MPRSTCTTLLVLLAGMLLGLASQRPAAGLADPLVIAGSELDAIRGTPTALIRVLTMRDGVLAPVPFQIDQRDAHGNWVWTAVTARNQINRYEYDNLGIAGPDWARRRSGRTYDDQDPADQSLLDANDLLVFMAEDLGVRAPPGEASFGNAAEVAEISAIDTDGTTLGWAYIAAYRAAPPPLSKLRYMRYLPETQTVVSPVYRATFSPQHACVLEQLSIKGVGLLDRTKLRGVVRAGGAALSWSVRFTENDLAGEVEGYIDGPVRIVRRTVAALRLGGLVPVSQLRGEQYFYPHHSVVPVNLSLGMWTQKVSLLLAADYFRSPFRQAFASGRTPAIRLRAGAGKGNLLDRREGLSWLALDGERASVVSVLTLPEDIRDHSELRAVLVQDRAASDPPETHPGVDPKAGYQIETRAGFPRGSHSLVGTYLYLPRPFAPGDAAQARRLAGEGVQVRVATLPAGQLARR